MAWLKNMDFKYLLKFPSLFIKKKVMHSEPQEKKGLPESYWIWNFKGAEIICAWRGNRNP